jgi:hypothetical protein
MGESNFSQSFYETLDETKSLVATAAPRFREMGIAEKLK